MIVAQVQDSEYYTVSEAARVLAVSRTTVWRWIGQGKLVAYRIGGRAIRIRPEDLRGAVQPVGTASIASESDIWANYDPQRVREAFRKARGLLKGIDREKLKEDIREARGQDSRGRPA